MQRTLIWILVIAVFVRLLCFGFAYSNVGLSGLVKNDAVGYVDLATNLMAGHGFSITRDEGFVTEVFRTPGLPLLIAPFTAIPHGLVVYAITLSMVAGILLPLLTYMIARRVADERTALIAAALVAIEPHAVLYSFSFLTEVPFMITALAAILVAMHAYDRNMPLLSAVAGMVLGYAVYIRPGYLMIFLAAGILSCISLAWRSDKRAFLVAAIMVTMVATVAPWLVRNHALTGSASMSGAGWRNVYTDFYASVRALENGTAFHVEKNILKDEAQERFGFSRDDINSPANSRALRDYVLPELWKHRVTVVKLEATLLFSFFVQDGYYYDLRNMGFVTDAGGPHISPTYELLTNGIKGVPAIWHELSRQYFIPVLGRLFTCTVLLGAVMGFFLVRDRMRYIFALVIVLTALFATAIGLGLDARMRIPVEPLFFIFAGTSFVRLYDRIRLIYAR